MVYLYLKGALLLTTTAFEILAVTAFPLTLLLFLVPHSHVLRPLISLAYFHAQTFGLGIPKTYLAPDLTTAL